MPEYGSKAYWDARYDRVVDEPFDWMVDFSSLANNLEALLPDKNARILLVGCGDAPFSADLFYLGGYQNQVNVDYSEIVISKQKKLWPEIQWKVLDCLDMKEVEDSTFDVVIDKSLIDTCMCYKDGHKTTMKLYSELHRVLKPGGRLITISLHSEEEVVPFGTSNPNCEFVASSCSLASERHAGGFHALCVFDKVFGLDAITQLKMTAAHPIEFVNAVDRPIPPKAEVLTSGSDTDEESIDYNFGFSSHDDLVFAFGQALDEIFADDA